MNQEDPETAWIREQVNATFMPAHDTHLGPSVALGLLLSSALITMSVLLCLAMLTARP